MNTAKARKTQNIQRAQRSPVRKFMVIQARMPTFRGLAKTDAQQGRVKQSFQGIISEKLTSAFHQNYTGRHPRTRVNTRCNSKR